MQDILLTVVSARTILLSTGTCVAFNGVQTILVEDAVSARLLEGVEAAVGIIIASHDALLQTGHLVRVHEVPFALVGVAALSGRAPRIGSINHSHCQQQQHAPFEHFATD